MSELMAAEDRQDRHAVPQPADQLFPPREWIEAGLKPLIEAEIMVRACVGRRDDGADEQNHIPPQRVALRCGRYECRFGRRGTRRQFRLPGEFGWRKAHAGYYPIF